EHRAVVGLRDLLHENRDPIDCALEIEGPAIGDAVIESRPFKLLAGNPLVSKFHVAPRPRAHYEMGGAKAEPEQRAGQRRPWGDPPGRHDAAGKVEAPDELPSVGSFLPRTFD